MSFSDNLVLGSSQSYEGAVGTDRSSNALKLASKFPDTTKTHQYAQDVKGSALISSYSKN